MRSKSVNLGHFFSLELANHSGKVCIRKMLALNYEHDSVGAYVT